MSAPDTDLARSPPPHRSQARLWLLLFGLSAGPFAWSVQSVLDYALAAIGCFPNDIPLAHPLPGPAGSRALLVAVNLLALLVALLGAGVSLADLRGGRAGEGRTERGRIRFMAGCGVLTGLGFAVAILFDTFALATVPQCLG